MSYINSPATQLSDKKSQSHELFSWGRGLSVRGQHVLTFLTGSEREIGWLGKPSSLLSRRGIISSRTDPGAVNDPTPRSWRVCKTLPTRVQDLAVELLTSDAQSIFQKFRWIIYGEAGSGCEIFKDPSRLKFCNSCEIQPSFSHIFIFFLLLLLLLVKNLKLH